MDRPYILPVEKIFESLDTSQDGLSEEEAASRLKSFGLNQLTAKTKISALSIFFEQFKNTLTLILIASTLLILFIYYFGGKDPSDLVEAGLIFAIVLMITSLGFVQEYKAEKAIEHLKKLLAFKAKVKRDGVEKEIDIKNLVPGDLVILEEGTKAPADIRLVEVFGLTANEASLTGEPSSVTKFFHQIEGQKPLADQKNMVFSGTIVSSGRGMGIVIQTGDRTEIGKIAKSVAETEDEETPIQKRLNQIGKTLGYIILGICSIVFIFIVFFADDYTKLPMMQRIIHSFIASVALAVAAIPEGLPAVVTISLALGTRRMLKKNALVRKLNSIETLGSTDVICADKTGTLTKGEMTVKELYHNHQTYSATGTGYEKTGQFLFNDKPVDPKTLSLLLTIGLECNNSSIASDGTTIGDSTELALLVSASKADISQKSPRALEVPFSSDRKMMSVVVKKDNSYFVYTKGAPETILANCIEMDPREKDLVLKQTLQMSSKALRTLAFAYKKLTDEEFKKLSKDPGMLESQLTFVGLQGMYDPPRVEIRPLIDQCCKSGIRVIMITGDHAETAKAVAKEIGIPGTALTGEQLDKLNDQDFAKAVDQINIYARVSPSFKMRIVEALKNKGHIVAMTGDGVNDAPALKKADIGIAMGITGTDVAKEASDMVLLDDQFSTIISAIEEGRGIFHNIRKFVNYLLACNIGEVLVVFLAVMIFHDLPLTATMLLWINVVTDGLPAVALGLDPAEKGIMRYAPKVFQSEILTKKLWLEMFAFGILMTAGVLGIYYMNLGEGITEARGAAFTAIVIFELVKLYIIRSSYKNTLFSNPWLLWAVLISILFQILIVYVRPLANLFEIKHIDPADWIYICVASILLWLFFKGIRKLTGTLANSYDQGYN